MDQNFREMQGSDSNFYASLVSRVMQIELTIWGTPEQKFLVRFQGDLTLNSELAYDQLAEVLRPHEVTPLFRIEDERHTIVLLEGVIDPKPSNPWLNLILFIFTVLSVLLAGTLYGYTGPVSEDTMVMLGYIASELWTGWPFAVSMLGILLAHEFGHYLAARYHKSSVTLPYFIPFPVSPFWHIRSLHSTEISTQK